MFQNNLRNVFEKDAGLSPKGIPEDYAIEHSVCRFAETAG